MKITVEKNTSKAPVDCYHHPPYQDAAQHQIDMPLNGVNERGQGESDSI
jgi:hypothetical protein